MPLAARQKATNASSVRPSSRPVVEHAGRAGRGEHEHVLQPLLRAGRCGAGRAISRRVVTAVGGTASERVRRPRRDGRRRRAARGRRPSRRRPRARRRRGRRGARRATRAGGATFSGARQLPPTSSPVQRPSASTASSVAEHAVDAERVGRAAEVGAERRRHEHDRVALLAVPAQPGRRVSGRSHGAAIVAGERRAGGLDVGDRAAGEHGVGGAAPSARSRSRRASGRRRPRRDAGASRADERAPCRRRAAGTARRSRRSSPCRRRRTRRRRRRRTAVIVRSPTIGVAARAQKPGQLFDTTSGSATSMPGDDGAEHAERHRQAVVVVGGQRGAVQPGDGLDAQPVGLDASTRGAGLGQLGGEVAEAVALLGPDEPDPGDRRRRRRPCAATTASVGTRSEMSAMSTSMPRSGTSRIAARRRAVGAVVRPCTPSRRAGRRTRRRPAADGAAARATCDPAAGDGRHGQRVARRRGVGLDRRAPCRGSARPGRRSRSSPTSTPSTPNAAITAAVSSTYGTDTSGVVSCEPQPAGEQRRRSASAP